MNAADVGMSDASGTMTKEKRPPCGTLTQDEVAVAIALAPPAVAAPAAASRRATPKRDSLHIVS